MAEVLQFYTLSHIIISLIGGSLLLALYINIKSRYRSVLIDDDSQKRVDKGLLYLSLAMFTWVAAGLWSMLGLDKSSDFQFIYEVGVNAFSIVNNMFILLALFYFNNAPTFIYNNEKNVKIILWLIVIVASITIAVSYLLPHQIYWGMNVMALPDLLLSAFLSVLLAISMYKTFVYRGLHWVAILALFSIALIFISQLPNFIPSMDNDFRNLLVKLVSKTSLIALFLVLATTWVIQLSNTPKATEMGIHFIDWSLMKLNIPSRNLHNVLVDFGAKTTQYKNLFKFALRRKYGEGSEQSILVGSGGEIKSQTYLTRVIDNINEILELEGEEKLSRTDLFTFVGEGKYRLRMLGEHILVDDALEKEFLLLVENQGYTSLRKT